MTSLTSSDGKPSGTKIWFSLCSAVVLIKYTISGVTIGTFVGSTFDATGAATLLAVFGGTYFARQNINIGRKSE